MFPRRLLLKCLPATLLGSLGVSRTAAGAEPATNQAILNIAETGKFTSTFHGYVLLKSGKITQFVYSGESLEKCVEEIRTRWLTESFSRVLQITEGWPPQGTEWSEWAQHPGPG